MIFTSFFIDSSLLIMQIPFCSRTESASNLDKYFLYLSIYCDGSDFEAKLEAMEIRFILSGKFNIQLFNHL